MTFTYDPSSPTASDVTKVRIEIGDTKQGVGVLPDGDNLTDEEIQYYIDSSSSNIITAIALVCDMLATRYSLVVNTALDKSKEDAAQIAKAWAARAKYYRSQAGSSAVVFTRVDGYSQNIPDGTVDNNLLGDGLEYT